MFTMSASDCTTPFNLNRHTKAAGLRILLLMSISGFPAFSQAVETPIDAGIHRNAHAALGIYDEFGRWPYPWIRLVYDPDDAPEPYQDPQEFLTLLRSAAAHWERVSDLRFLIGEVDANVIDDTDLRPEQFDFRVRVAWDDLDDSLGIAGPSPGYYEESLGYAPFLDGAVWLNNSDDVVHSDKTMLHVLVHELGHLVGLGHSDNPASVMYANPYNVLSKPREDDVRAVQTLYGRGQYNQPPDEPVAEWLYTAPLFASDAAIQEVFRRGNAHFSLDGSNDALSSISPNTPENTFVWVHPGDIGDITNLSDVDVAAAAVIVDPLGYVYEESVGTLTCPAGNTCGSVSIPMGITTQLKQIPGTWRVYIIDREAGQTLLALELPVTAGPVVNHAPVALIRADQITTFPSRIQFTLTATDQENDAMTARWYLPFAYDAYQGKPLIDELGTDGTAYQFINFVNSGIYTFFVDVRDDAERYHSDAPGFGGAGKGFQTLLRVTVNVPFLGAEPDDFEVVASQAEDAEFGGSSPLFASTRVLSTVSDQPLFRGIVTNNGKPTTARFTAGASIRTFALSSQTQFNIYDTIVVAGRVLPQTIDVGKPGTLYVVIRSITAQGERWYYRDEAGAFWPWNIQIPTLKPAQHVTALTDTMLMHAYTGNLPVGQHQIFFGYRAEGNNTLHYTNWPLILEVEE